MRGSLNDICGPCCRLSSSPGAVTGVRVRKAAHCKDGEPICQARVIQSSIGDADLASSINDRVPLRKVGGERA